MAKAEWGTKRVCLNCSVRFYDMLRDPIICPSCETVFDPTANLKGRRSRTTAKAVAEKAPKKVVVVEEEDEAEEDETEDAAAADGDDDDADPAVADDDSDDDEEESESAIEDVSELGDDDVTAVIDVEGGDEEETA